MNFVDLLTKAKIASDEKMILIEMYKPLLVKEAVVNGAYTAPRDHLDRRN